MLSFCFEISGFRVDRYDPGQLHQAFGDGRFGFCASGDHGRHGRGAGVGQCPTGGAQSHRPPLSCPGEDVHVADGQSRTASHVGRHRHSGALPAHVVVQQLLGCGPPLALSVPFDYLPGLHRTSEVRYIFLIQFINFNYQFITS